MKLRCPTCGAPAETEPRKDTFRCSYCNAVCLVQRRVGYFERKETVERRTPEQRDLPLATEELSRFYVIKTYFPILLSLLGVGGLTLYLSANATWWSEGAPLLVDWNDDGIEDVVGFVARGVPGFRTIRVAAVDGDSGDILWASEPTIATYYEDEVRGTLVLHDGLVVFAHANEPTRTGGRFAGDTLGWRVGSGELLWRGPGIDGAGWTVGASESSLVFRDQPSDESIVVQFSDGSSSSVAHASESEPVAYDGITPVVGMGMEALTSLDDIGDVEPILALRREGTDDPWTLLISPGVARTTSPTPPSRDSELAWVSRVDDPHADPQATTAAVSDEAVFSAYQLAAAQEVHVVANALDDGRLLWDVDLAWKNLAAIDFASDRVYVAGQGLLMTLDPRTGETLVDFGL